MEVSLSRKLSSLGLISQKKLENILNGCNGKKDLIIDPVLFEPFERVCGASWLRQRDVDKIFKLEPTITSSSNVNKVYIIPSCLIKFKYVLDQINSLLSQDIINERTEIVIIIVPKCLSVYETLLEEEGLSEIATLKSFQWEMINIDEGVLTLEIPTLFKSLYVNKDACLLGSISNSLWTFFQVVGTPNIFVSVGKNSHYVMEQYGVFRNTFDRDTDKKVDNEFGAFLIIDRDQDYASSLLTPATYSGLLYELFNVKCGKLDLDVSNTKYKQGELKLMPESKMEESEKNKKIEKVILNSENDSIYSEIRYRHFSSVFSVVSKHVKELNSEGSTVNDLGISQMKQYIATKLQKTIATKKNLSNHLLACETIVSTLANKFEDIQITEYSMLNNKNKKSNFQYMDEQFGTDINMLLSLRNMCLLSLTQGLSYDEYNSLVTKYLHAFGHKYLYVFQNLASAGLLNIPSSGKFQFGLLNQATITDRLPIWQNNFQVNANKLKQLPLENKNKNDSDGTCPSYVFNQSYIPLIAVLSKIILQAENSQDFINKISVLSDSKVGGPVFDTSKSTVDELGDKLSNITLEASTMNDLDVVCKDVKIAANLFKEGGVKYSIFPLRPKTLFIFVVGGVTQAEIASCHLIEKLLGAKIVIASDNIISGSNLVQTAF